jgi:hypothetical protein
MKEYLLDIKKGKYDLAAARSIADKTLAHVTEIADEFCATREDKEDEDMRELLQDVQYEIMKIAVKEELK